MPLTHEAVILKYFDHPTEIKNHQESGGEVISPGPRDVLVDFDAGDNKPYTYWSPVSSLISFNNTAEAYGVSLRLEEFKEWPSKSGNGNTHYVFRANQELTPLLRCFLQLLLGSDPKRERHVFFRTLKNEASPNVLFKPVRVAEDTTVFGTLWDADCPF
jgi:hypothetical protein